MDKLQKKQSKQHCEIKTFSNVIDFRYCQGSVKIPRIAPPSAPSPSYLSGYRRQSSRGCCSRAPERGGRSRHTSFNDRNGQESRHGIPSRFSRSSEIPNHHCVLCFLFTHNAFPDGPLVLRPEYWSRMVVSSVACRGSVRSRHTTICQTRKSQHTTHAQDMCDL